MSAFLKIVGISVTLAAVFCVGYWVAVYDLSDGLVVEGIFVAAATLAFLGLALVWWSNSVAPSSRQLSPRQGSRRRAQS